MPISRSRYARWGAAMIAPFLAVGLAWAGTAPTGKAPAPKHAVTTPAQKACPMAAKRQNCAKDPAACAKQCADCPQAANCAKDPASCAKHAAACKSTGTCPMSGSKANANAKEWHVGPAQKAPRGATCPMHTGK